MMIFGLTPNEKANATWLFGNDERIKNALDFIKEKDIQSYESIIVEVEKNYAEKDKITAYIDNAVIVAPVLISVVKNNNCKYEISDMDGEEDHLLTLKRMICYDETIVVDGKYKIIGSTCFTLTPNAETLIFEEGVEYIEDYVLCQTDKLKKIVFPKSLIGISSCSFGDCPNLGVVEFKNPDTRYYDTTFEGSKWAESKKH